MSRRLVAIRHAQALYSQEIEDELLPLSVEGSEIQRQSSEFLLKRGIKPHFIQSSPLLRAQQTAEILGEVFSIKPIINESLGYNFNTQTLLQEISSLKDQETLFMVGHEPTLAQFVNALVGKAVLPYGLEKSGSVVIDFLEGVDFEKASFVHYYQAHFNT